MGFFGLFGKPAGKGIEKVSVAANDGYEAAAYSRHRSTIWTTSPELAVNPSAYTRAELLRNARYLVKNLPILERALCAIEANAVGGGLFPTAATEDKDWNPTATKAVDKWASSVFCTADNELNLWDVQKLISRELIIAGEIFLILQKADTGFPQISLANSERVRHSGRKEDSSVDGLWLNDVGRVVAYNVFFGNTAQKIDAASVIHLKRSKDVGALRGICAFAASQNNARDFLDALLLEKLALKAHSALALAVEKDGGEAANSGIYAGATQLPVATGTNQNVNRRIENPFGGAALILDKGEKVSLLTGERTSEGFSRFVEILCREICLNLNLPYEYLVNSASLNGVGVRFVMADCDATFRDIEDRIIDGAMMRLYSWVVASFIKDGKLPSPAGSVSPWDVTWIRPLRLTVDNGRNSASDIALVNNGMLTLDQYFSARGLSWEEQLRQRATEEKFLDDLSKETGVSVERLRNLKAA